MNLIVAVDKNHGIGCKGKLLYHLPADLQYFKQKTLGKTVVMGYNTYLSLPVKPLKNRLNVVLKADGGSLGNDVVVCSSLSELFLQINEKNPADVFVIGGESVYNLLSDYCEFAFVTEVEAVAEADTFYHGCYNGSWELVSKGDVQEHNGIKYRYCVYKNLHVKSFC